MIDKFIETTREGFKAFLDQYQGKLQADICGIREPPMLTVNDFELADKWPDSTVAWIDMNWLGPNDEEDHKTDRFWKYYIIKEK